MPEPATNTDTLAVAVYTAYLDGELTQRETLEFFEEYTNSQPTTT